MIKEVRMSLRQDGFAVVRGVLSDHDFEPLEAEFAVMLSERIQRWKKLGRLGQAGDAVVTSLRQGLLDLAANPSIGESLLADCDITLPHQPFGVIRPDSPFHVGPALLDLVTNRALLDTIEDVIGPDITLSPNCHARYKLPTIGSAGVTPWHRDAMTHVRTSDPVTVVTCWVPTDDVSEENGCLVVVPGGHRTYPDLVWPLTPEIISTLNGQAVALPVTMGDIVLLDKNVPHSSLPNLADAVRWSFDFRYYPTAGPSDRPWFPALDVRRSDPSVGLCTDASEWRRRWELTRTHFATTGQLVPGRPEYARVVAERHIQEWTDQVPAGQAPWLTAVLMRDEHTT